MTRRDVWLIIVSLVLGPAIGGGTFIAFAILTDGLALPPPGQTALGSMLEYWPIIMTAAYVFGAIPAFLSAVLMSIASRHLPRLGHRLIAAPLIGAAISLVIVGLVIFSDGHGAIDDGIILAAIGTTGAVAGFVSLALVEFWHPLPKPPAAS